MTALKVEIRTGAYYDSVILMQLQSALDGMPGVTDTAADAVDIQRMARTQGSHQHLGQRLVALAEAVRPDLATHRLGRLVNQPLALGQNLNRSAPPDPELGLDTRPWTDLPKPEIPAFRA